MRAVDMLPGRRRSSEISQNVCFYLNEICMQGFLKKSPPMELFANQSSWKKRYFLLVRVSNNVYSLKYYTSQNRQHKGEIRLEDVKYLCYGIEDRDKMSAVQKMFKCSPELAIFLATEKRDYYLLGDSKAQVEEWFNAISKAWKEVWSVTEPQTCSTISSQRDDARTRSTSCPVVSNSEAVGDSDVRNFSNVQEEVQGGASRPHSDPFPCSSSGTTPARPPSQGYCTIKPVESKRLSAGSNSTDEGGVYDVPSAYLKCVFCVGDDQSVVDALRNLQCIHCSKKSNRVSSVPADMPQHDVSDSSEEDADGDDPYERMDLIRQSFLPTYVNIGYARKLLGDADHPDLSDEYSGKTENRTTVSPLDSPVLDGQRRSELKTQTDGDHAQGTLLRQTGTLERSGGKKKRRTPPLTHGRLLKLFSSRDQSEFMELNVCVPKEAASTSMGLLEVEDKICVSKWNGPEELGYPFHVGDHILAVNEIGIESSDDVLKIITMARSKKVKITVLRVPVSAILNTE